jgi:ribosomal protein L19
MIEVKLRKNVPLPDRERNYKKYDFDALQVGDSLFVACTKEQSKNKAISVRGCISARQSLIGKRFEIRQIKGGVGCWRVE